MMLGDYTKVPLRKGDRWTGAPMQQGRVLLDHEWNLNLEAAARTARHEVLDVIGPAGVPAGSTAFKVSVSMDAKRQITELTLGAGRIWVDGMEAYAPSDLLYGAQDQIAALPTSPPPWIVYLDVFPEHIQPAEAPGDLVEPAIAPVDSASRTRVGYRVRVAAAEPPLPAPPTLSIACQPPALTADGEDPLHLLHDGLLRVEVLDSGAPGSTPAPRMAWSYENGAATIAVAGVVGPQLSDHQLLLAPHTGWKLAANDLVEVSGLSRRADRISHGPLYTVQSLDGSPDGDIVTLDRAHGIGSSTPDGLVVRRWDGATADFTKPTDATIQRAVAPVSVGVTFTPSAGQLLAGDWWGARVRRETSPPVEERKNAEPDGIPHATVVLARIDESGTLTDLRPTFRHMVDLAPVVTTSVCTLIARPGDNLQAALDSLVKKGGGELCLTAGTYELPGLVTVNGTDTTRITIQGVGPATVIRSASSSALLFDTFDHVTIRRLRLETPGFSEPRQSFGSIETRGCTVVVVEDCDLICGGGAAGTSWIMLDLSSTRDGSRRGDRAVVRGNHFTAGSHVTAVECYGGASHLVVADNVFEASDDSAFGVYQNGCAATEITDNYFGPTGNATGWWGAISAVGGAITMARNVCRMAAATLQYYTSCVLVSSFDSAMVSDTVISLPAGSGAHQFGVNVYRPGPFYTVSNTSTSELPVAVGVDASAGRVAAGTGLGVVSDTLALGSGAKSVVVTPPNAYVVLDRNVPIPQ